MPLVRTGAVRAADAGSGRDGHDDDGSGRDVASTHGFFAKDDV